MPGDPLRAKFIAETFLENPVLVNNVRGVQGYTGTYKGVKVSVMASGMGMPSIGIYSHELYNVFGVENILRVGSAGALQEGVRLYDLVLGQGACTDSNWAAQFHLAGTFAPIGSFDLLIQAVEAARELGCHHVGNVLSSDAFYGDHEVLRAWTPTMAGKMGILAIEMEAAALYMEFAARDMASGPVYLHHFRPHPHRGGDYCRRTAKRLYGHDEGGAGSGSEDGEIIGCSRGLAVTRTGEPYEFVTEGM